MISCPSCSEKHQGTCGSSTCVDMVEEVKMKQKQLEKDYPKLIGMKATPGIKPYHEHQVRVRPTVVLGMRKNKAESRL